MGRRARSQAAIIISDPWTSAGFQSRAAPNWHSGGLPTSGDSKDVNPAE
jgi:hypothetical protein